LESFFSHPLIAVVALLGALVFVHEFGHFLVGRACGIAVEIFSIGFGAKLFSFRHGHTEYRLSAVPLGGYVKFYGASPGEPVPAGVEGREFFRANYWRRMATIAAGPGANFLLAAIAFAVLGLSGISHPPAIVGDVLPGAPAELAGVFPGDKLIAIDGVPVVRWRQLEASVSQSADRVMKWTLERNAQVIQIDLKPAAVEVENALGRRIRIGRAGVSLGIVPAYLYTSKKDGWAYRSGIRTGDLVKGVSCPRLGIERNPKGFGEFAVVLWEMISICDSTINIGIVRDGVPSKIVAVKADQGLLNIANKGPLVFSKVREFVAFAGIEDAQLLVWPDKEDSGVFLRGDRLVRFAGKKFDGVFGLRDLVIENQSPVIKIGLIRDFREIELDLPLKAVDSQQAKGRVTVYTLPVSLLGQPEEPAPVIEKYSGFLPSLTYGFEECGRQMVVISGALAHLVSGEIPIKALGGPIMIAKVAGDSAKLGWQSFLTSLALISVNLGLVNLFPIPVLDGGQMVLFSIEAILRRPLNDRAMEFFHKIGFIFVAALVLLATYNDLSRFWKSMLIALVGDQ
jgi:regulator of sigma E protease